MLLLGRTSRTAASRSSSPSVAKSRTRINRGKVNVESAGMRPLTPLRGIVHWYIPHKTNVNPQVLEKDTHLIDFQSNLGCKRRRTGVNKCQSLILT